jgi:hypothetical protein
MISQRTNTTFPIGTFLINLTGAVLLGLVSGIGPGIIFILLWETGSWALHNVFHPMYEGFVLFQGKVKDKRSGIYTDFFLPRNHRIFSRGSSKQTADIIVKGERRMQTGEGCKILKIYISEDSKMKGQNLHSALVFKLKELGIAGVTVTHGIEGMERGRPCTPRVYWI